MSNLNIKERVEQNVTLWLLGTLFTSFIAGFGTYQAIYEIANVAKATIEIKEVEIEKLKGSVQRLQESAKSRPLSSVRSASERESVCANPNGTVNNAKLSTLTRRLAEAELHTKTLNQELDTDREKIAALKERTKECGELVFSDPARMHTIKAVSDFSIIILFIPSRASDAHLQSEVLQAAGANVELVAQSRPSHRRAGYVYYQDAALEAAVAIAKQFKKQGLSAVESTRRARGSYKADIFYFLD